jgi:hypothetical protein
MRHVRFESADHPTGQPVADSRARPETDPNKLLAEALTYAQLARIAAVGHGPDVVARCDAAITALSIQPASVHADAAARRDAARRDAWRQPLPSRIQADADAELERRRQGGR